MSQYKKYLTVETELCTLRELKYPAKSDLYRIITLLEQRQKETDQEIVDKTECPHHSACGVCLHCLAKRRLWL